jgi:ATP-binding cassette, subfamily G (WHITE), eye pigment precursor transporter
MEQVTVEILEHSVKRAEVQPDVVAGGIAVTSLPEESIHHCLRWDDVRLTVPTPNGPLEVLKGVSGFARPGRILAIMGSSGAGKTCLLDIIAGRIRSGKVTGTVLFEGVDSGLVRRSIAYVPQEDTLLNSATVEEVFETAALLRLGPISASDLKERVETTLRDLKLQGVRSSFIGGADIRGISGGQKRRVSIGQEICSNDAPVLLLDEPTTGLDSKTAESVIANVIELSRARETIVIATIHQPSSLITAMFDDFLLLSEGYCVYFGTLDGAVETFATAGFPCPSHFNPTDWFLHVLDRKEDADAVRQCYQKKQQEQEQIQQQQQQQQQVQKELMVVKTSTAPQQSPKSNFLHQTWVLTVRNARQWIRDPAMFMSEIVQYIFLALFLGGMYFNLQFDLASGVWNRTAGLFIILSVLIFTPPFTAITVFSLERHLFFKERRDNFYSASAWVLAKTIVTFPVEGILCLAFSAITYFMMGLQHDPYKFFIFFGVLLVFQLVSEAVGLLFAVANKSPVYAIVWLSLVLIVALSLAGFLTYSLPPWYSWIADANVLRFALLALIINEFDGIQFTTSYGGIVKGLDAVPVGLQPSLTLGQYVAILVCVLVGLRLAAVVILSVARD